MTDEPVEPLYLIWSNEHGAWWRPHRCGYTKWLADAGRYTRAQAISICLYSRGYAADGDTLTEVPVRQEDALSCHVPARDSADDWIF